MLRKSLLLCCLLAVAITKICPNPEYSCPDSATCCKLASGEYGCCPMPEAVCCEDHIHCCPGGAECDVEEGTCNSGGAEVSKMMRKFSARRTSVPESSEEEEREQQQPIDAAALRDIICPGGKERCPPLTTCCELETGQFGCCPSPNAVCCQDHMHCCPDGYRCDTTSSRCKQETVSGGYKTYSLKPSMRKFAATPNVVKEAVSYKDVRPRVTENEKQKRPHQCGDGYGCSRGQTCCSMLDDEDGPFAEPACCPLVDATCCAHGCCPGQYVCSKDGRSCEKPALNEDAQYLKLLKKTWFDEE